MAKKKKSTVQKRKTRPIRRRVVARAVEGPAPGGRGEPSLARRVLALYQELGRLGREAGSGEERRRLFAQQDALGAQLDALMSRRIAEGTRGYREAGAALSEAAARVRLAEEGAGRLADAVMATARVVDALARVLAAGG